MTLPDREAAARALQALGELLEARGEHFAIVVIGGAALNLLGIVDRATVDVDILAFARATGDDASPSLFAPPEPMPASFRNAIDQIAGDMGLPRTWLNTGPALQWAQGLPPGLERRVEWERYGALEVGLASRYDLIYFKLYAAADSTGPRSKHFQDLIALRPTDAELQEAAAWVREQDVSPAFHDVLQIVIDHVSAIRERRS